MSAEESSKKEKPITPVATPIVKPCNPQMESNNVITVEKSQVQQSQVRQKKEKQK